MTAPSVPSLLVERWSAAPWLDASLLAAAAVYLWATTRMRYRWPPLRIASFLGGLLVLAVALQSGLAVYDDRLLSVHMVQHLLVLLVAPLLILEGRPLILALRTLPASRRRPVVGALGASRRILSPLACLSVYSLIVLGTHLPGFFDAAVQSIPVHLLEHGLLFSAGMIVWWPVLDGDPSPAHRLGGVGRLVYVIVAMVPMAVIGAWLAHAAAVAYTPYARPALALGVSAVSDQQTAGAIMWVAGNVIMALVGLALSLQAMLAEERRQRALDRRQPRSALMREGAVPR